MTKGTIRFGITRASKSSVMPSMTGLESNLSQATASISFDAKPEFGRMLEGTQGANGTGAKRGSADGAATDTGMAALLGMWATIFQQQVLPEPVAVDPGITWQEGGSSALSATEAQGASGPVEEASREAESSPMLAANILGLTAGQAVQASILWQLVQEPVGEGLPEPEAVAAAGDPAPAVPALPLVSPLPEPAQSNAVVEEAPVLETTASFSAASVSATPVSGDPVSAVPVPVPATPVPATLVPASPLPVALPVKTEAGPEAPVVAVEPAAFEPVPLPQKAMGENGSSEQLSGEKTIPVDSALIPVASSIAPVSSSIASGTSSVAPVASIPAPVDSATVPGTSSGAPVASSVVPAVEAPPVETVVNLKRKVSERILPKTLAVDVKQAIGDPEPEPIVEPSKLESTSKTETLPDLAAKSGPPETAVEMESGVDEEPKPVSEQVLPEAAPRPEAPAVKATPEEPVQRPAPHSLDPAPRAATSTASPQAPPAAPAAKPAKAAFIPEPPPAPPVSREAKTISIRIPLNDSSTAMGAPVRHLDLIFNQRNNDLTLQFNSPNTEIRGQIEESMPTLLSKLQTENWTAAPAELTANVAQAELGFDGRRRAESLLPAANQFDSLREPIASADKASQGFNFDDSQADRKDAQDQSQQGRNRKKEQAWQSEFDEVLEP